MNYFLRKFVFLLAVAVAAGPAMAKESSKVSKKSKLKTGLFSKKKTTTKKTTAKKKSSTTSAKKKRSTSSSASEGKSQYKNKIININKASASALSAYLVGIGPVKAMAIVDFRKKNGRFTSLKDLMKVEGIGEATFDGLRKNVSTSRGTTVAPEGYKMEKVTSSPKKRKTVAKKKRSTSTSGTKKRTTSSTSARRLSADDDSAGSKKKVKTKAKKAKKKVKKKVKSKKKKTSKKKSKKKDK